MKYAGSKAHQFSKSPDPASWAFLVFGDDEGVVSDTSRQIRQAFFGGRDDLELITLDQDHIKREPATLFDALEARSLLGNPRLIRVPTTGDKIASLLLEAIRLGEADPKRFEAKLVITAGSLQKRSKLRSTIEGAKHATALHVFADNVGDILKLTRDRLAKHNVDIDDDALALFARDLSGHRGLANQETEKLALYGHGLGRPLGMKDIRALSAIDADQALHDLIRAVLHGQTQTANDSLDRLTISGTSPISVLRALQRETLRLLQAHTLSNTGGDIGMKLRPPVFRNDWPKFRTLMNIWPPKRLKRILERVYDAEESIKTAGPTGGPLIRKLISELTHVAAQSS